MAPGFAAGLAARVAMLRLAERLPGGRLVASEFQGDAAPEVGPGVAAVDREGFVELGQRLLHLAFLQPAPAFGHVVIGVGDELDVEHRPPHHVSEHHAERAEPPEAGHFRSRHHRDGDLGDLLAAELDAHPRVLALGHQIARLRGDLRERSLEPFRQVDRHLLGGLSGLLRRRARLVGQVPPLLRGAIGDLGPLAVRGRLLRLAGRGPARLLAWRPAHGAAAPPLGLLLAALALGHPVLRRNAVCSGAALAATSADHATACAGAARHAHRGPCPSAASASTRSGLPRSSSCAIAAGSCRTTWGGRSRCRRRRACGAGCSTWASSTPRPRRSSSAWACRQQASRTRTTCPPRRARERSSPGPAPRPRFPRSSSPRRAGATPTGTRDPTQGIATTRSMWSTPRASSSFRYPPWS